MDRTEVYCPKCGAPSPSGTTNCYKCGAALPDLKKVLSSMMQCEQIRKENDTDQRFLAGYSFGPGCLLYLLNRVFWPLFLINLMLGLALRASSWNPDLAAIHSVLRFLCILVYPAFLLWLGSVIRKKRWAKLRWRSFSQFQSNESAWNTAGCIGWVLSAILIIIEFILLLSSSAA